MMKPVSFFLEHTCAFPLEIFSDSTPREIVRKNNILITIILHVLMQSSDYDNTTVYKVRLYYVAIFLSDSFL